MTDPAARPHGTDAQAARSEAGGQRPALGGLWLLLVPLACCGGPLLITSLAAAGALAWGALGLGAGVLAAVTVLVIRRSRGRACGEPAMTGSGKRDGGFPAASGGMSTHEHLAGDCCTARGGAGRVFFSRRRHSERADSSITVDQCDRAGDRGARQRLHERDLPLEGAGIP